MRRVLGTTFGVALAAALLLFAPGARADEANQATRLTFNQPIQLPGNRVLPAGTYWFKVPNGITSPNVVEVLGPRRNHVIAELFTIPAVRQEPTDQSELVFARQSPRKPMFLADWFYPGDLIGHEFLYSPRREAQLSESQQVRVLAHSPSEVG